MKDVRSLGIPCGGPATKAWDANDRTKEWDGVWCWKCQIYGHWKSHNND